MANRIAPKVMLRAPMGADVNFIFSSWLKSFRNSPFARGIENQIYFKEHHDVIEQIINQSTVVIACLSNDPNHIVGYAVASVIDGNFTLHYIYVKHTFRRLGVGKLMLDAFDYDPELAACATHFTHIGEKLAMKYGFVYHPYLLVVRTEEEFQKRKSPNTDLNETVELEFENED